MFVSQLTRAITAAPLALLLSIPAAAAQTSYELNQAGLDSTVHAPIPGDPIKISSGFVSGKILLSGVKAYLGIPYARPPIGELRWADPQPAEAWEGVLNADRFGAACAQPASGSIRPISEDCLFLNVWLPPNAKAGDKLPVIFWNHGGSFTRRDGGRPQHNGANLAAKGVIVVNANYRLGVFGRFAHPELTAASAHHTSGAQALQDILLALAWTKQNIQAFGGDPENITYGGQSAGAAMVSILQASPTAKGLFKRVFGFSGSVHNGMLPTISLKEAERTGLAAMQAAGAKSIAELRKMPWDKVLREVSQAPALVDGYVLPKTPRELFATGAQNDVPALIENQRDEALNDLMTTKTLEEFRNVSAKLLGENAGIVLPHYTATNDQEAEAAARALGVDEFFGRGALSWARTHAEFSKSPVYLGVFSRTDDEVVDHGASVAFWLGNLDFPDAEVPREVNSADLALSEAMMAMLVQYAKVGNPSIEGAEWPAFTLKNQRRLNIGSPISVIGVTPGQDFFATHPDVQFLDDK
ncbi:carboxylesterase/lipase family protein [Ensifer aridi]|uniref:carboxylesterase/lipase family protein n=1 Tax=Ensifer aridi TaxID=1708715 RepID=UPI000A118962|nr:carboxylesterase family protein [Ensifer aridi]